MEDRERERESKTDHTRSEKGEWPWYVTLHGMGTVGKNGNAETNHDMAGKKSVVHSSAQIVLLR